MADKPTCATCSAMKPVPGEGNEGIGWCCAEPPKMIGTDPNKSFFPLVNMKGTWCRQWKAKEEIRQ